MKKKIKVEQLTPGMFIHDFNSSWLDHPFFSNSTKVKNEKIIEKVVKSGIREVYIDTDRGLDVADAPTEEEVKQEIQSEIDKFIDPETKDIDPVPLQEELVKAKEIKKEAKQTIQHIMDDARFGKQIEKERVEHVVMKMVSSIFRNQNALISLGRIKQADEYTYMHSMSVCILMISFGKHLGFDLKQLRDVGVGAMLHDIGKMKVPQDILNSRRRLSDKEYEKMKEHVEHGRILLEETPGIAEASVLLAAQHHERLDGSGYPNGLTGDQISHYAQAAAIVDVYDAITSERCYNRGLPPTEALKKLFEWSACYFNSELVQQFIRCIGIYPVGSLVRLESGLIAIVLNNDGKSLLHPVVRVIYDAKKGKYIAPYDINLSQRSEKDNEDRITSYESPDKINVIPEMYL
jgi:putative nucleotidyltransferase with HDIG domain